MNITLFLGEGVIGGWLNLMKHAKGGMTEIHLCALIFKGKGQLPVHKITKGEGSPKVEFLWVVPFFVQFMIGQKQPIVLKQCKSVQ